MVLALIVVMSFQAASNVFPKIPPIYVYNVKMVKKLKFKNKNKFLNK